MISETVSASTQKGKNASAKKKNTAALDQPALQSLTGTKSIRKRRDSLS